LKSNEVLSVADVEKRLDKIRRVILVGSGKGGVGKSFVACGLGTVLARNGYRTGLLDIDIHGSSVPDYLGLRGPIKSGKGGLQPRRIDGLKVMSIGFFTGTNPVPMRGANKQELITQLFSLTNWGELDYLVVDLPPSMGDELLSAFNLFSGKSLLVLVTTPSLWAANVVSRLSKLAASERIQVSGVVINMAYIREGERIEFPFGKVNEASMERKLRSRIIALIPLDPAVSTLGLRGSLEQRGRLAESFGVIVKNIVYQGL
jgi:ATP-binding protein involved in chromosome partitioning